MYQIGDKVKLKYTSKSWTCQYAGQEVEIISILSKTTSTVRATDGYEFFCPNDYFDKKTETSCTSSTYIIECTCGAHKTWGENCPSFFHSDYCSLYKPRKED